MIPGRTYSFVMWAGDAKGRVSAKSNTLTVTLPVDTTPPAAPVVSVTGTTSSTVGLAWPAVADDDYTCCTYRVFVERRARQRPVDRRARGDGASARRCDDVLVHGRRRRPVRERVGAERRGDGERRSPGNDTAGPTAPGNLYAFDFGCETWLFWEESVDDVDPQSAILYEVRVNGVFDGALLGIDRWITYGTQTSNTFSVQAVDSAGNRSPTSSLTLDNQSC